MLDFNEIFKLITENSNDSIFLLDKDSNILYCNANVLTTFDFTPQELIGKNFFLTVTPQKYNKEYIEEYNELRDACSKDRFELECIKKDGTSFAIESYSSCFIHKEKPFCIYSIRDISDRKIQERKDKDYQDLFFKLTDKTHDAIIWIDNNGNIAYWNPAAEKMFGYSFTEVYEKNLHDLIAPQRYHKAHHEAFDTFIHTGKGNAINQTVELDALKRDGTEFPVELSVSAVKIDEEWTAIAIIRDVTNRKNREKQLSNILTQFETVFSAIHNNVYIVNSQRDLFFLNEFLQLPGAKKIEQKCYKAIYNQNDICKWCPLDKVLKGEVITKKINTDDNSSFYIDCKTIDMNDEPSMLVRRIQISD